MNIIETLKRLMPALGLMALCSAAILYLPQLNRDAGSPPAADSVTQQKAPPANPDRGEQA
ncbi:hypothetical protein [Noviherbaspirillum aridicola]|uniref:Uncharacterized protein n=1 Tax=Noviherbaspirillum aridicola TaxID=2849687 RepID=A0ABQ4PZ25_9BURK|nr:hypothetical protein [Noviherbaspirillum aridicola]GIZ50114.1 hypothetical protein NCCP691_01280 [Noviherbaspirillum aridicola]